MFGAEKPIDLDDVIVSASGSVLEVLRVIDKCGLELALVCGRDRHLEALVTDADIRRFFIRGGGLDSAIREAARKDFTPVGPALSRAQAVGLMLEKGFNCLPVVDEEGRVVNLHTLRRTLISQRADSWAVIMAGGQGARLGELTHGLPKPLLPIGDRPILEHIVQHLVSHGFHRIFISVNYLREMIEDHFGDGRDFYCRIEYLREPEPLGTGGPLALLPELPARPLLVMNGDLLTRINVDRLMAFHEAGQFEATIAIRHHEEKVPYGVAELEGSLVKRLVEKPTVSYRINAGIYVLQPELVRRVPPQENFSIIGLLNGCLDGGERVGAYEMQESWNDVGLPEDYRRLSVEAE